MEFDFFTFMPLIVAAFVLWKLRSVLGTRTGHEKPPFDPYQPSEKESRRDMDGAQVGEDAEMDNVVTLPNARGRRTSDTPQIDPIDQRINELEADDPQLAKGLRAIRAHDGGFDPDDFLNGAKMAYEMIVTSYADGDEATLRNLLAPDVFQNFKSAMDERKARGEHIEASFVGMEKAEIFAAAVVGKEVQVSVEFVSQMISATYDENKELVEGDPQEVAEIRDSWTFARPARSSDPNWTLIATDA